MLPLLTLGILLVPSFLSPPAAAASPSTHVFRPPYLHTIPEVGPQTFTSFCHSSSTYPTAGSATPSSGNISVAIRVVSAGCGQQYAQASASIQLGFGGPTFRASSNQTVTVTFNWTLRWSATLSATLASGAVPYSAFSLLQIYGEDIIYDQTTTNGVAYTFGNIFFNQTANGTVNFSHVTNQSVTSTPVTLVAGHLYDFEPLVFVTIVTFAEPGDFGGCLFDMASHGNGGRLNSITVS